MSEIIYLTDVALITCVLDKKRTEAVLLAARNVGARVASVHAVHGWGVRERFGALGVAVESEKDVIVFMVSSDQQDLMFEAIYKAAELNVPGIGYMFVSPVERVATYVPEAVRKELGVNPE
ncbi:P-II family nitrogen regulator [Thalassotalea sp. Y01]|uniref:P-II family nitrogen regulator n=1 Tax=Thalassotalea sp. Y01 TaxID=2729613 RepID=UPI00145F4E0F|nr:P-II family nitrogen regulator [Thalassotalea sp. Y01]NMP17493.1 P-II family nitrogen regulator [Thalassotalea sp. Y01]